MPARSTGREHRASRAGAVGLALLAVLLVPSIVAAVVVDDTRGRYPVRVAVLEDPARRLTIAEVSDPARADRFVASDRETPNLGLSGSAFWVRFDLNDRAAGDPGWILEVEWPVIDRVELYMPEPSGAFTVKRAGDLVDFAEWDVPYRNPAFRIPHRPGTRTYYLRFE